MTIEKHIAESLSVELSINVPNPDIGILKTWHAEGLEIRLLRNAVPMSDQSIIAIPWAMVVLYEGEYLYAISMEKEDLRILSSFTGESVKELQADYGVKGFFTEAHVSMYGDDQHEDLGTYLGATDDKTIEEYLMDAVLDSFDVVEDPQEA